MVVSLRSAFHAVLGFQVVKNSFNRYAKLRPMVKIRLTLKYSASKNTSKDFREKEEVPVAETVVNLAIEEVIIIKNFSNHRKTETQVFLGQPK